MKDNNLVAKHARKFNKAHVHIDRKKAEKKGYRKHKKGERNAPLYFCLRFIQIINFLNA